MAGGSETKKNKNEWMLYGNGRQAGLSATPAKTAIFLHPTVLGVLQPRLVNKKKQQKNKLLVAAGKERRRKKRGEIMCDKSGDDSQEGPAVFVIFYLFFCLLSSTAASTKIHSFIFFSLWDYLC